MCAFRSRHHNPTLKTSLICLAITILAVIGITVGEQALYMYTFPSSSAYEEIDGVYYHIGIGFSTLYSGYDIRIRLYTDQTAGDFPQVNATEMWVIPSVGIWAWRKYEIINLEFDQAVNSTLYRIDYEAARGYIPPSIPNQIDVIVKLNATDNRTFYLHYYDISLM
jgi:hypothetical protein